MSANKFRKDINALRMFAVISVVIYHFKPGLLNGGFIGVDIFFVISGFLMTSIILGGMSNNTFSIGNFYSSRLTRIVPPLAILCLVLIIFGWFYLVPFDYEQLGKHIRDSITFISNITYNRESGYFDSESKSKWLLHTWSLSVEFQFYLLYPALLLSIIKLKLEKQIKEIILALIVLGFSLSVYMALKIPNSAYYTLPSRTWELLIGSLAYFYKDKRFNFLNSIGWGLLILSVLYVNDTMYWPSYFAILPTVGTLFILLSNKQSIVYDNIFIKNIGLWSYSIYLWHWPIVVYLYNEGLNGYLNIILGIFASIIMGAISYFAIEKVKINRRLIVTITLIIIVYFLSVYIKSSNGLINVRYPEKVSLIERMKEAVDGNHVFPHDNYSIDTETNLVMVNHNSSETVLFIGDSFIQQYYPTAIVHNEVNSLFYTEGGCMPILGVSDTKNKCKKMNDIETVLNDRQFSKIIIGGNWPSYLNKYNVNVDGNVYPLESDIGRKIITDKINVLLTQLKNNTDDVYFILPHPTNYKFSPNYIETIIINGEGNEQYVSKDTIENSNEWYYNLINPILASNEINKINPLNYLCSDGKCKTISNDYLPYYSDCCHMNSWYSKKIKYIF
ncbi:acyltransferase family protein [Aliivibrio sp. S10_S31]|uniref:acyltransferase family protein n=1 Tax=Aliivibrio sp. S10_S31 TaxID=2720224 RepID=UPI001680967F|nr:acyltransferase family protein [Aliivibrio sp. S10_S31]MBD1567948.1 acyltransferase [Aliivibrio sp. S10_S31]